MQWLEDNQDKSLEEIEAAEALKKDEVDDEEDTKAQIAELESGQVAKSLVCNECGKLFRNSDLASYHASKTCVEPATNCEMLDFADKCILQGTYRFLRINSGDRPFDRGSEGSQA